MGLHFTIKKFKDLSSIECYKIFKLRFDIFVVEQNCIYDEFDNYDLDSLHIQLHNEENELIAYSRILKFRVWMDTKGSKISKKRQKKHSRVKITLLENQIQRWVRGLDYERGKVLGTPIHPHEVVAKCMFMQK